jgi:hypothetical protein
MLALVVVNKFWECDPALNALLGDGNPLLLRAHWLLLYDWPRGRRNPPKGLDAGRTGSKAEAAGDFHLAPHRRGGLVHL